MNERVKAMGLTNTKFKNPDGLNASGHYSSCNDLATMALTAMQDPVFREMVNTPVYYFPHPTRDTPRELKTSNALLTKYYWVDGIKTGSTPYAGYCMVASGEQYGVRLLVVLLGAADNPTRWREVEALFDYGFSYSPKTLLAEPDRLLTRVPLGDPLDLQIDFVADQLLLTRLRQDEVATGTVTLPEPLSLPVHAGDPLGSVEFTLQGESLGSVDLYAGCAIYSPSIRDILMHARNWYLPDFVISERGERYPH
jgi:D-alanyl-D-alanine carboxypeptidase (penicillin-binding protein 5/6)